MSKKIFYANNAPDDPEYIPAPPGFQQYRPQPSEPSYESPDKEQSRKGCKKKAPLPHPTLRDDAGTAREASRAPSKRKEKKAIAKKTEPIHEDESYLRPGDGDEPSLDVFGGSPTIARKQDDDGDEPLFKYDRKLYVDDGDDPTATRRSHHGSSWNLEPARIDGTIAAGTVVTLLAWYGTTLLFTSSWGAQKVKSRNYANEHSESTVGHSLVGFIVAILMIAAWVALALFLQWFRTSGNKFKYGMLFFLSVWTATLLLAGPISASSAREAVWHFQLDQGYDDLCAWALDDRPWPTLKGQRERDYEGKWYPFRTTEKPFLWIPPRTQFQRNGTIQVAEIEYSYTKKKSSSSSSSSSSTTTRSGCANKGCSRHFAEQDTRITEKRRTSYVVYDLTLPASCMIGRTNSSANPLPNTIRIAVSFGQFPETDIEPLRTIETELQRVANSASVGTFLRFLSIATDHVDWTGVLQSTIMDLGGEGATLYRESKGIKDVFSASRSVLFAREHATSEGGFFPPSAPSPYLYSYSNPNAAYDIIGSHATIATPEGLKRLREDSLLGIVMLSILWAIWVGIIAIIFWVADEGSTLIATYYLTMILSFFVSFIQFVMACGCVHSENQDDRLDGGAMSSVVCGGRASDAVLWLVSMLAMMVLTGALIIIKFYCLRISTYVD